MPIEIQIMFFAQKPLSAYIFLLAAASLLVLPYLQKTVNAYYLILAVPAMLLSVAVMFQGPVEGEHTLKKAIFLVLFAFLVGSVR